MFKSLLKSTTLLSFITITFFSCTKDSINLNDVSTQNWNPEFGVALLNGSLNVSNLNLTSDSTYLQINSDSSVSLVYNNTFASFKASDFVSSIKSDAATYTKTLSSTEVAAYRLLPIGSVFSVAASEIATVKATNDATMAIDSVILNTGTLTASVQNTFSNPCDIAYTIPGIKRNGAAISGSLHVNAKSTASVQIDIAGVMIDLSNSGSTTNSLQTNYTLAITKASNDTGHFTFTNAVANPSYKIIYGDMGKQSVVNAKSQNITFDIFRQQQNIKSFELSDAQVKFNFRNNFGVPITINISEVKGTNSSSTFFLANAAPFTVNAAPFPGSSAQAALVYDKTNPKANGSLLNLPSFLSKLPTSFQATYSAYTNYNSSTKNKNFIADTSTGVITSSVIIPLTLKTAGLAFKDTSSVDFGNVQNIQSLTLHCIFNNGFPFSMDADLLFVDANYNVIYHTQQNNVVQAAQTDNAGNVISKTSSSTDFLFDSTIVPKLANIKKLIITGSVSSAQQGSVQSTIYAGYTLDYTVGAKTVLKQ